MKKIDVNFLEPSQQQLSSLLELYQAGRYADAEKLSLSITQEFPKHPFAWKVLAAVLKQTGRISESLVASQTSVQLDPQDAEAHINLGIILKELGRLKEAEIIFRKVIELKPDYAEAHNNLGGMLQELGRLNEAEIIFRKVIELKPDYAEAHNNLGGTLIELGRFNKAELACKKAIELKPDNVEAYNNLFIILQKLNKLKEAEKILHRSIQLKELDERKKAMEYCENVLKTKLTESPEKSSFVYREVSQRGFFLQSNLEKVDDWNKQLPLLTWPFLDFIKTLDLKDIILHELGSGSSTLWFSNVFKCVESYETNKDWYEKLKPLLKSNVILKLSRLEDIYNCSIQFKPSDWLLIDFTGKRTKFIHELVKLSDEKLPAQLILDNPEWYRNGAKILIDRGYTEIPFFGFKSGEAIIACTSLFILKKYFKMRALSKFYYPMHSMKIDNSWDTID
jgi:tetratricopeptide (TPR) repeat protein